MLLQMVRDAIARLGQAVWWLTRDLPLNASPVVTMVTALVAPATASPRSSSRGSMGGGRGGSAANLATNLSSAGCSGEAEDELIICTFPALRQTLEIPVLPPPAVPATGGSGGAAAAPAGQLAVRVWLHSPLGPAVAAISEAQLRRSADAGAAPVQVVAVLHEPPEAVVGHTKLEVILQFAASRPVARSPSRFASRRREAAQAAPASGGTAFLAVLAVPLLSAFLQSVLSGGMPAINVLQSVAFLVSSLAAIIGIVVLALARAQQPAAPPPAQQVRWAAGALHALGTR